MWPILSNSNHKPSLNHNKHHFSHDYPYSNGLCVPVATKCDIIPSYYPVRRDIFFVFGRYFDIRSAEIPNVKGSIFYGMWIAFIFIDEGIEGK